MRLDIAVAMVTNCRQPVLLRAVVSQWVSWNIPVFVSTDDTGYAALQSIRSPLIAVQRTDVSKEGHGTAFAAALRRASRVAGWVLRQDDDIIAEKTDKLDQFNGLRLVPNSVSGVRLVDPAGGRWYDWASFNHSGATLLPYGQSDANAYVTGGAQLISRGAVEAMATTYEANSKHRSASDAKACLAAAASGCVMVSPTENSPAFIHLDPARMVNVPHKFAQDNIPKGF